MRENIGKPFLGFRQFGWFNPSTPKSDQFQISPAASPRNITSFSRKNVDFHSSFRLEMIILPVLIISLIHFSLKGCENALFELGSWWYREYAQMAGLLRYQRPTRNMRQTIFTTVGVRIELSRLSEQSANIQKADRKGRLCCFGLFIFNFPLRSERQTLDRERSIHRKNKLQLTVGACHI